MKLSGVVITRDEENNILDCLSSLDFCDERIVVDSGSQDQTVARARSAGADVYFHPFENYADQKNFAISKATGEWVLLIDADERVNPALKEEIRQVLFCPSSEGYWLIRRNRVFGRFMQGGDHARDYQLRLVRAPLARFQGLVHERIILVGKTERLKEPLFHESTPTISAYMKKLNNYTALEARSNAERKMTRVWLHMMLFPLVKAVQRWIFKAGFRDGVEGFIFIVLSAYYDFIKAAKRWELSSR